MESAKNSQAGDINTGDGLIQRFIRGYAEMVKPLTGLTKKGKKFLWFSQYEEAFSMLKKSSQHKCHGTSDKW